MHCHKNLVDYTTVVLIPDLRPRIELLEVDVEPFKTNFFLTFEDILLMFLSPCSLVSVFVPLDLLQLLYVVIYGLQQFEK